MNAHTHTCTYLHTHTYQYKTVSAQSLLNSILAVHSSRTELRRQLMTRVTDSNWINLDSWRAEWPYTLWSHACHVFPRWGVLTVWMYHPSLQARKGGALCSTFEGFLPSRVADKCFNDKSLSTSHHMFGAFHPFASRLEARAASETNNHEAIFADKHCIHYYPDSRFDV